jgi:hypothetical protein
MPPRVHILSSVVLSLFLTVTIVSSARQSSNDVSEELPLNAPIFLPLAISPSVRARFFICEFATYPN